MRVLASVLTTLLLACGGGGAPAAPSTTNTAGPNAGSAAGTEGAEGAGSGSGADVVAACKACVAEGKNFTGGRCESDCYMDTYCIGPDNAAAPTCSDDPADYNEPTGW